MSNEYVANNGHSGGAQTTWLASARSRSDIDFVVAYFHHCAYCTCAVHGSEGGVRANWTALFDQHSVDLVINGHNHIYECTDPIKAGAGTTIAPDSYEGAVDNDSAVASVINEPGGTTTAETVAWSRVRFTGYCPLVVESVPARRGGTSHLRVRGLAEDGTELDRFTLARKAG